MGDNGDGHLISHTKETYGASFEADLLEQYKLYVQSAENVSSRRIASIRYLLTISTALVALYGLQSAAFGQGLWLLPIPVIGIASALVWHQIIRSHKDLNKLKFDLIHEFEKFLPAAPFRQEWDNAKRGRGGAYRPVTDLERQLPWGFVGIHLLLIVMIALASFGAFDWTEPISASITESVESANDGGSITAGKER